MKRKVILILLFIAYLHGRDFGTILSNAIVLNDRLTHNDAKIIQNIHEALINLAENKMIKKLRYKDENLVIKFFLGDGREKDAKVERYIVDSIKTIILSTDTNDKNSGGNSLDLDQFKDFSDSKFDPVSTMVLLIEKIKRYYGEDNGLPIVYIYDKDGDIYKKPPLKAIFSITYKITRDYHLDKKFLNTTIIYASTDIQDGEKSAKSIILQRLDKKIDISEEDSPSYIAGYIYNPLSQKISNLINEEIEK